MKRGEMVCPGFPTDAVESADAFLTAVDLRGTPPYICFRPPHSMPQLFFLGIGNAEKKIRKDAVFVSGVKSMVNGDYRTYRVRLHALPTLSEETLLIVHQGCRSTLWNLISYIAYIQRGIIRTICL